MKENGLFVCSNSSNNSKCNNSQSVSQGSINSVIISLNHKWSSNDIILYIKYIIYFATGFCPNASSQHSHTFINIGGSSSSHRQLQKYINSNDRLQKTNKLEIEKLFRVELWYIIIIICVFPIPTVAFLEILFFLCF